MKREYTLKKSVTKEDLMKFGFATYNHKKYTYVDDLYKKIIRVRFLVDFEEKEMIWEVYDATNQKSYNTFYSNPNGMHNQVVIECFERFNEAIEKMVEAGLIEGED